MIKSILALIFLFSVNCFGVQDSAGIRQQLEVTATTTSTLALDGNAQRTYLLIQNKGTVGVYVHFVSAGATTGLLIPSGGNYEPVKAPIDKVYLQSVSGSQSVVIIEGGQ